MLRSRNMSDYTVVGNVYSGEDLEVLIAFKGENTDENLYIINKIPFTQSNEELFKKFFFYFKSDKKDENFEDLFVLDKNFYAIFKYVKCESIKIKFNKDVCVDVFDKRRTILEEILMKIYMLSGLPLSALICISDPENVRIDLEEKIHIAFDFRNIFKFKDGTEKDLYKNLHDIIFTLLQMESEVKYNKALHVVLDKCKNGIYASIPELIVELKRAVKISKSTNLISYLRYRLSLRKNILTKIGKYATTAAVFLGLIYLGYTKLIQGTESSASAPVVSIGETTYNGDVNDESSKDVDTEKKTSEKKKSEVDITLPAGLDIEYEDYVVQYGDTISSICEDYYKDSTLIGAVASFNDVEINDKLVAGSIIKLPNRTAIALYLSN